MDYAEFHKLCENRHSCRNFNGKPISDEDLKKILSAARLCPSACNSQPWRIKIVTGEENVRRTALALQDDGMNPYASKASALLCLYPNTPVLFKKAAGKDQFKFVKYDIGALSAYITLAAETLGISSLIIGWVNPEALSESIEYDGDYNCEIVIALGYTDDESIPKKIRKPMDEISF